MHACTCVRERRRVCVCVLELLRGSQAPRRAVCGTRGSLRTMHGGGSAPSCCAFTHRASMHTHTHTRRLSRTHVHACTHTQSPAQLFMGSGQGWQPTPVFLPGESHEWRSLVGYSPRGRKESDTGRLWQFAHPRPLSILQRGLAPRSKGKARAELRPARRQARLPHSRSLLLPGRER